MTTLSKTLSALPRRDLADLSNASLGHGSNRRCPLVTRACLIRSVDLKTFICRHESRYIGLCRCLIRDSILQFKTALHFDEAVLHAVEHAVAFLQALLPVSLLLHQRIFVVRGIGSSFLGCQDGEQRLTTAMLDGRHFVLVLQAVSIKVIIVGKVLLLLHLHHLLVVLIILEEILVEVGVKSVAPRCPSTHLVREGI